MTLKRRHAPVPPHCSCSWRGPNSYTWHRTMTKTPTSRELVQRLLQTKDTDRFLRNREKSKTHCSLVPLRRCGLRVVIVASDRPSILFPLRRPRRCGLRVVFIASDNPSISFVLPCCKKNAFSFRCNETLYDELVRKKKNEVLTQLRWSPFIKMLGTQARAVPW